MEAEILQKSHYVYFMFIQMKSIFKDLVLVGSSTAEALWRIKTLFEASRYACVKEHDKRIKAAWIKRNIILVFKG